MPVNRLLERLRRPTVAPDPTSQQAKDMGRGYEPDEAVPSAVMDEMSCDLPANVSRPPRLGRPSPSARRPEIYSHPLPFGLHDRDRWQASPRLTRTAVAGAHRDALAVRRRPPPSCRLPQVPRAHSSEPEASGLAAGGGSGPGRLSSAAMSPRPAGWWNAVVATYWASEDVASNRLPAFWAPTWWSSTTDFVGADVDLTPLPVGGGTHPQDVGGADAPAPAGASAMTEATVAALSAALAPEAAPAAQGQARAQAQADLTPASAPASSVGVTLSDAASPHAGDSASEGGSWCAETASDADSDCWVVIEEDAS